MNADVIGPSVAGQPVVHITGFVVLVLVTFTGSWAGSLVTVAHEGGHIVVGVLTGRYNGGFHVNETKGGGETAADSSWGAGAILTGVAGYLTPPLVGLAGANLVLAGQSWSLLWAALVLLLGAYFQADDLFTGLVVTLAGVGIGWTAVQGSPELHAGVAVGLVWLMLFGAIRSLALLGLGDKKKSDPGQLARITLIPRIAWVALFWFVAVTCLWIGGRRLLGV